MATHPPGSGASLPNDLDSYWMPFTAQRDFKNAPRMIASAEGCYLYTPDGRAVLDGIAGLWCVNAGHNRSAIVDAIRDQAGRLDYATAFQLGHPAVFHLASRVAAMAPAGLDRVFFSNSGSEAVETALKIARAYHRKRGEGGRQRLIGRERAYHGVNFGGLSVGGIGKNRAAFGAMLAETDHLPHTYSHAHQAFTRGQPDWGAHLADELDNLVALHGAGTIAAVIVEPLAGSTGVLVPPTGYLQRLREICDRHGILLIFDEVITGFGRLGASFAAQALGVTPDIITCAKGLTNGAVPMGATVVSSAIQEAFMDGPEHMIELFHGYTYSGHPLAAAAGLATLEIHREEGLAGRAGELAPVWEELIHSLADAPHVRDIRNLGLVGAIELAPGPDGPGTRGHAAFKNAFFEQGVLIRVTGDTIALSPPLTMDRAGLERVVAGVRAALNAVA